MNNCKFDALLYSVSEYLILPEIEMYDSTDDNVQMSKRCQRKIKRFLRKIKARERSARWNHIIHPLKRVAVAFILICTVGLICTLGLKATREALWKAVLKWHDKYIEVSFVPENTAATESLTGTEIASSEAGEATAVPEAPSEILDYREPTDGLLGYERYEISRGRSTFLIEYEKDRDILIIYCQYTINQGTLGITNHDTTVSDMEINGYSGLCFAYNVNGIQYYTLLWCDSEYRYEVTGNIPLDELTVIAESIKSIS